MHRYITLFIHHSLYKTVLHSVEIQILCSLSMYTFRWIKFSHIEEQGMTETEQQRMLYQVENELLSL